MNSKKSLVLKRAGVVVLGAMVVMGSVITAGLYAPRVSAEPDDTQEKIEANFPELTGSGSNYDGGMSKEETTYVIMDADGDMNEVVVNEWIRNGEGLDEIKDSSSLTGIVNTSGNESFKQSGSDIVWSAGGNDIHYQGKTDSGLPVEVDIEYYLDGEKMTAEEIAGKSGEVEIRFMYTVNHSDFASVDGNGYTLKHPYTMASGLLLESGRFSNISVENGKVISEGDTNICVGIAFPGLGESLGISKDELALPEEVVIKATANGFAIDGTYTIALSGLLSGLGTADNAGSGLEDKLSELESGLNQLSGASDELLSGSEKLASGADKLAEGVKKVDDAVGQLYDGSKTLKKGVHSISEGASSLDKGLQKLSGKSSALNKGGSDLQDGVFELATQTLQGLLKSGGISDKDIAGDVLTPSTYTKVLNTKVKKQAISAAESKLRAALGELGVKDKDTQTQILSLAYNQMMANKLKTEKALEKAGEMAQEAQTVAAAVGKYKKDETFKEMVDGFIAAAGLKEKLGDGALAVASTAVLLNDGIPEDAAAALAAAGQYATDAELYQAAAKDADDNVNSLAQKAVEEANPNQNKQLKQLEELLDGQVAYVKAVEQYTAGVDTAAAGSAKLAEGAKKADKGAGSLKDGLKTLSGGTDELVSGTDTLSEGAGKLAGGMNKFDKEGIKKFVSSLNDSDLKDLGSRFKALKEIAEKHIFIGGTTPELSGETKIIFKTAEIKAE